MAYKGRFVPKAPEKYKGDPTRIIYRSLWELKLMKYLDSHDDVLYWASEEFSIPYRSPIDGKYHNYVPDFMVQYTDKDGVQHVELVEIKPSNQTTLENARSQGQKIQTHLNAAKWTAAQEWCSRKGIRFKVINEDQIFRNNKPRKAKKRVAKKRKL